ncbi:TatD family hydrolase [Cellulomonas bogoriensis]|uniref:Hydrolase TatD n=1 Tax=Cellulomonas bogoriensis 69B4 = DSM 16987 TaxID=1386082 RepID=A0A0A0C1V5_9CELL|nr:TatD family hydrolase [Cellulomonas bogoriensis]KGM13962.1 hydrolase TatD [Cellulomonas bogoriensis 69B4 = DSM 16987]
MARSKDRSWPEDPQALPAPVVDDHTHLDTVAPGATGFDGGSGAPGVAEQIARAARVGVTRMVQIGCELPSARWTAQVVGERPELVGGVALHPNEAPRHAGVVEVGPDGLEPARAGHHEVPLAEALTQVADLARDHARIRVIGETGLDHFRAGERGREVQRESFRAHIAIAKELDLVLQIHDRDAHEEVVEVLLADGAPARTVFHCFSGDAAMARVCAEQGWYMSFAGPVTFGNAQALRAALREVPTALLQVETDAPYLTPHPVRGRPNAPYLLPHTVRAVAAERGTDLAELCRALSSTAEDLYGPW